nr:peroxidase family protein [Roseiconus nitratireducens]
MESRQLLAADVDALRHNPFESEDVNDDGHVSAIDALALINAIDRGGDASMFTDVNNDGRQTLSDILCVINRLARDQNRAAGLAMPDDGAQRLPKMPSEVRSIDGTGNHLVHTDWGSAGQPLLRVAPSAYGDGVSSPAGQSRPGPRVISNRMSDSQGVETPSQRGLSAMLYVWGQFIDHDIDLTEPPEDGEPFDIKVPAGDPHFDPEGLGDAVIPLTRSRFDPSTGTSPSNPRQQINQITSYLDASMVYGSDLETANRLRSFEGGRLKVREGGLLPVDDAGMVVAGDVRASENVSLTAIQTLFVREHNRLADQISGTDDSLSDEQIYQRARALVIAEVQAITYNEFLPALLGDAGLKPYVGYDPSVDPSVATEFSTAAFRFGHSTLNERLKFFDNDGRSMADDVELAEAFFRPSMLDQMGIDSLLKFNASTRSQEIDLKVVDGLRNFLFGPPGAGGMDLVAMNIQRGRDHGLADYNATRRAYGLPQVDDFAQITSDSATSQALEELYGTVDDIDLWVGLLAEDHRRDASVGELAGVIIADQFQRLRDGDRMYYETIFKGADLRDLQRTTLADVIERNSDVAGIQDNVFFMLVEIRGKVTLARGADSQSSILTDSALSGAALRDGRAGVPDMMVELLDNRGERVDATVTDHRGEYRFWSIPETGDYQVRLAATGATIDMLVSSGDLRLSKLDFEIPS